jgi:CRISPR type IV-associated protein Csf3
LKVTFLVSGGWVPPPYPLHLDAVLAYVATQRSLLDIEDNPSVETLRALGDDLPLARFEQDGDWVWKASAIVPAVDVLNDSRFYTQRRDKVAYAEEVRDGSILHGRHQPGVAMKPYQFLIDTLRGIHRNLLGYYPVQRPFDESELLKLVAYCVGDKDLVEEMLTDDRRPTHLGARRRSGHGRIESVQVEEAPEAKDAWMNRVRPWPLRADDVALQAACRAPYWAAENRRAAFCPVSI